MNEDTNVEDTDVDLRTFLLEIERRLQKLEGTKDKIPAKGSDSKIEIEQPTLKTGEVYGEFNKGKLNIVIICEQKEHWQTVQTHIRRRETRV